MNHRSLLHGLLAAFATTCAVPAQTPDSIRSFATPDGSRFVLVPTPTTGAPPVVHWVVVVPTPLDDDPAGALGLSRAVLRASLNGTWTHASRDVTAERRALRELDAARTEVWQAAGAGKIPDELAQRHETARLAAAELGDPAAWRRALSRAPATDLELREVQGASLLHVATTPSALPRVAVLLLDWRENAALRGFHDRQLEMRNELAGIVEGTEGRLLKEVLGTTFLGAAAARYVAGSGSFVPIVDARRQRQRLVHPSRTLNVLTGRFEAEQVEELLAAVFKTTALPAAPAATRLRAAETRGRRSTVPAERESAVALAWPIPRGVTSGEIEVLSEWLASSPRAFLMRSLRRGGEVEVSVSAPFPANAVEPLFVLQVSGDPAVRTSEDLETATLDRIARLWEGDRTGEINAAAARVRARHLRVVTDPKTLAFELGTACGILGTDPETFMTPTEGPDSRRLRKVAEEVFGGGPRTVAVLSASR